VAHRVATLGVLVDTQPAWLFKDGDALRAALGPAPGALHPAMRTKTPGTRRHQHRSHVRGRSRHRDESVQSFLTMATAVSRRTGRAGRRGRGASRATGPAHDDHRAAALVSTGPPRFDRVGKLGDLVILSDLLTVPEARLRTITADMTIVGGVVFEKIGPRGRARWKTRRRAAA
jgi:hypothetical protein